jgi:uncharacterized membrane protein
MTHKATGEPRPDHPLERLIFFSDAVFAIAITLLVIDLHVPHVERGAANETYLIALANMAPSFFGFFVSFWVIAAFWAGHHRAFALAGHSSKGLIGPNLALLCAIVLMPFTTSFMGANMGATVPTALYNLLMLVTGLLNIRLVHVVTSAPVVSEAADRRTVLVIRARGWGVTLGAAGAFAFSFVDSRFSEMVLITIPMWMKIVISRAERRADRAGMA